MSALIVAGKLEETLACVREQYAIVDRACCTLAEHLRTGAVSDGLQAVERICVTLLVADELIGFVDRARAPGATLGEARRARESMMRLAAPWLAVAVRDLPGAEILIRLFVFSQQGAPDGRRTMAYEREGRLRRFAQWRLGDQQRDRGGAAPEHREHDRGGPGAATSGAAPASGASATNGTSATAAARHPERRDTARATTTVSGASATGDASALACRAARARPRSAASRAARDSPGERRLCDQRHECDRGGAASRTARAATAAAPASGAAWATTTVSGASVASGAAVQRLRRTWRMRSPQPIRPRTRAEDALLATWVIAKLRDRHVGGGAGRCCRLAVLPGSMHRDERGHPVYLCHDGTAHRADRPSLVGDDDDVIRLREWATTNVHPLPEDATGPVTLGTAETCAIRVRDPSRQPGQVYARLERRFGRWSLLDARSDRGVSINGAQCLYAELRPGVEISLGGAVTLIAESPRLILLREALERLLGWSPARRARVDEALRQIRDHDLQRRTLTLCGGPKERDLIPIAQELHRLTLTEAQPFVVYDPRRPVTRFEGVAPTFSDLAAALREAKDGTLCLEHRKVSSRDVLAIYMVLSPKGCQTHIVHCGNDPDAPRLPTPRIVIPPLGARKTEIDRLIREYLREATALMGGTKHVRLSPTDRA